jgi:co-chaperonin GroES (HSP10)
LTVNQLVRGSSPRWGAKIKEDSMIGTPVGKRVLLEMNDTPTVSSSGIVLASAENVYFDNWKVVAISPEVETVKVDDVVYVDFSTLKKTPGRTIVMNPLSNVGPRTMIFVEEEQIVAVLEN